MKQKYGENEKLCYMYKESLNVHVKIDDVYKDIAEVVETRFDTSNYEIIDRWLPKGKNKKVTGLMKDKWGVQIMKRFIGLRVKIYIYLKDNNDEDKRAKETKKFVLKRKLKFQSYKKCFKFENSK